MAPRQIRFGDFQRYKSAHRERLSFNKLTPALEYDGEGNPLPYSPPQVQLSTIEVARLLQPYISVRLMEQVKAVVPLALYLALFQLLFLQHVIDNSWQIVAGLVAVIFGLMLFMEGLQLGLMPFGTLIGNRLPKRSPLPMVLAVTLMLGIGVTFAEPAIGALKAAGSNVSVEQAPYLYALLNQWADALVLVVGISVGLAAVVGTLRFLYGWSLKPLIYTLLTPILGISLAASFNDQMATVLGLAWDCGAVTTGPVTVPLVLALGIGIASAAGKGNSGLSGFGIVTLASLFPILGVLLLALYVSISQTPEAIIAAATSAASTTAELGWYEQSPGQEFVLGFRAILPLVIFLYLVLRLLLKESLARPGEILYGIALTVLGMCTFNLGLTYGLSALGGSAGSLIPSAFMAMPDNPDAPLYVYAVGMCLALAFAWFLGYGATIAEPALNALGITTERMTNGVFKKKTLITAVSVGVACGIALGVAKLIFNWPLMWLILPGYLVAVILTVISTEEFVNVAWDSAGVTTGPITVPLVLAMGLGLGNATAAIEGFGILCMASVGPIITVLISGLWTMHKARKQAELKPQQEQNAKALL